MAENISLTNLANLTNEVTAVSAINSNNSAISSTFTDVLSRSGVAPNQMQSPLDMNSNRILNLPAPVNPSDPVRLQDSVTPVQLQILTSAGNTTSNTVYSGPLSGAAALPTFRSLVVADLPAGVGGSNMINGKIVESHSTNAVTFAIKTLAGADPSAGSPVYFWFPGNTAYRAVTSALSITIPAGQGMGATSNVAFRIWIAALDNAGTVELVVRNCTDNNGVQGFPGTGKITTTTMGGGSIRTSYSTTSRSSVSFVVLGYAEYSTGLVTAGTWNASPSSIVLFGIGVPLPGTIIKVSPAGTRLLVDQMTPGASYANTQLSATITPESAANLLQIVASGAMGSSAGTTIYAIIQRSGINIGVGQGFGNPSSILLETGFFLAGQEVINTTSSVTYFVAGQTAGTGIFYLPVSKSASVASEIGAQMIIQEVQA